MSDDRSGEESVWTGFNWTRERYEELIARVTPGYHEQGGLIADLLEPVTARWRQGPFRVLDLGAGTGSLSRSLLTAFPEAEVTALDVSAVMLAECRQFLASFGARAQVVEGDFSKQELGSGYRAVVSRLAIHHLRDVEKRALYRRVFEALIPGGVFVDSDLIVGETEAETRVMLAEWRAYMAGRGDDPDEWQEWLVGDDDYPATERERHDGLEATGFVEVRTVWKHTNFAVVSALKPS